MIGRPDRGMPGVEAAAGAEAAAAYANEPYGFAALGAIMVRAGAAGAAAAFAAFFALAAL